MTTHSSASAAQVRRRFAPHTIVTIGELRRAGWSEAAVRAQVSAGRWQRSGRALILHNGPVPTGDLPWVAPVNCGPRAALTGFTAAGVRGLTGWDRQTIDVLVPAGARVRRVAGVPMRVHWAGDWAG